MGGGSWSASVYDATTTAKVTSGTSFAYSSAAARGAVSSVHDSADPTKKNSAGKIVREARDSVEHPASIPAAVGFDVTGSMGAVPITLQTKLAELFGLVLRKGYAEDFQLAVGAYGDAVVDQYPLQAGQFESDNRADEVLDNLIIEHGGGGNNGESAHLFWYFFGKYAELDSLDKRGKKGYLFTVGDEVPLPTLTRDQIARYIDPDHGEERDLTREEVVKLAQQKFEVYHIVIQSGADIYQDSYNVYSGLLGKDHVIVLQDEEAVAEVIAGLIGFGEGTLDTVDELLDDLTDVGASDSAKDKVGKALAKFTGGGKGAVAVSAAPKDLVDTTAASRL